VGEMSPLGHGSLIIGRKVPEAEEENIRELLFYTYRIIYRVETERF